MKKMMIVIEKPIFAEATELGKGARVDLRKCTPPIRILLQRSHRKDPLCISGDTDYLQTL